MEEIKTQAQEDSLEAGAVSPKAKEVSLKPEADSSGKMVVAKKARKTSVLMGCLMLLVVIGVGFGVTGMVLWWQEKNREPETIVQVEEKTEIIREDGETITLTTESVGQNEQRVKQLLVDLALELAQWVRVKNDYGAEVSPTVRMVYDTWSLGNMLVYRPQGMYTSVLLNKSYGLELDSNSWTDSKKVQEAFADAIISESLSRKRLVARRDIMRG